MPTQSKGSVQKSVSFPNAFIGNSVIVIQQHSQMKHSRITKTT